MKRRNILLTTGLVIFLFLAGCTSQGSTTSTNTTTVQNDPTSTNTITVQDNPTSTNTITVQNNPTSTSTISVKNDPTILGKSSQSLYLPFIDLNTTTTEVQATAVGQSLPPEKWQEWPVIPAINDHALEIYRAGIAQGNDPMHFSKVGDCQNIHQYFLGLFDTAGTYRLGDNYAYLQETIDYFHGNWDRASEAVRTGFNVASVLNPFFANPENCQPGETPLVCEIRIWNPSFVIISMEKWTEDRPVQAYEDYLRQIVDYVISKNVLPILATKADNLEGDNAINQIVARVAADYDIPMWNFWAATQPLTAQGLMEDRFHLTNGPNYYDSAESMDLGWPVRNLTGLLMVDAVWKAVR